VGAGKGVGVGVKGGTLTLEGLMSVKKSEGLTKENKRMTTARISRLMGKTGRRL
jgi:hypothetical protein